MKTGKNLTQSREKKTVILIITQKNQTTKKHGENLLKLDGITVIITARKLRSLRDLSLNRERIWM